MMMSVSATGRLTFRRFCLWPFVPPDLDRLFYLHARLGGKRLADTPIVPGAACRRVPREPHPMLAHLRRLSSTLSGQTLLMLRTD
jgi:hypothetical protein